MSQNKIQLIRVAGVTLKTEITPEEQKYRETEYPDEKKILKKNLACTSCGKDLKDKIISQCKINVHPVLEVIWCNKCEDFYEDGEFSVDEDGSDKYCRWCAQGGELYCCSYCSVAFCSKCVKRNIPRKIQKALEDDDWRCFVCVTEPLWPLRALCDAAKRYVEARQKTRKPTRSAKVEEVTEEDTTESETHTRRTRRRKRNDEESTEDEKYNADSEENASEEANKSKRKYASSSEEVPSKKRGRRSKMEDEKVEEPHPDEKKKEIFEAIVTETLNDCGAFRKILSKKEGSLKKDHLNIDVAKLTESIEKADEDFLKFFKDAKASLENIEKIYKAKMTSLKDTKIGEKSKESNQSETNATEKDAPVPLESNENIEQESNENEVEIESKFKKDETADDVMEVDSTLSQNASPQSFRKSSVASVNGKTDEPNNANIPADDDVDLDETEIDKSKSIGDSLAVNVDSIVDSLKTNEFNSINANKFDDTTISDIDLTIDPPMEDDASAENNISLQKNDETVVDVLTEPTNLNESAPLSPLNKDKIAKQALLQSSSDNPSSSENENIKKKSSDSDLSGVSVIRDERDSV